MEEHSESKKLKLDNVVAVSSGVIKNEKMNPLLNSVVIKEVFESLATSVTSITGNSFSPSKQVTLDDLKNFRLVCKSWHGETVKLWRQSATLKIIGESEDNESRGGVERRATITGMRVKQFLQYWDADTYQLRTRAFVRFNLSGFGLDGVGSDRDRDHTNHRFWQLIKDSIEHLRVENCAFGSPGFYREFRALLRMGKPNLRGFVLKDLKFRLLRPGVFDEDGNEYSYEDSDDGIRIRGNNIRDSNDATQQKTDFGCGVNLRSVEVIGKLKDSTVSWKNVFKNSPNLERLRIGSWRQNLDITLNIEDGGLISNLKHLCIGSPVYNRGNVLDLLTSDPPLETLDIFIAYQKLRGLERDIGLNECLQKANQSETLTVLHLTCDDIWGQGIDNVENDPFYYVQVAIPTLKELCIWGNLVGTMNFLKLCPNLEILKISLSLFEKKEDLDRAKMARCRITEGYWFDQCHEKKYVDIVKLTETELQLKHLKHFHYDIDKLPVESWKLLGTWMPNLRKLEAVFTNETVAIVCEQWPDLWEVGCLFGSTVGDEGVVIMATGRGCQSQNLGLKNLCKLRIEYQCGLGKLTDACVSGGLLEMGCLTHLEILNFPKISDDSLEKLKDKIPCARVVRSCPDPEENEDFECCQRRKYEDFYVNMSTYK